MTSFLEVKDFIVTTDANSNKNISSTIFLSTSPAAVVAAGSYAQRNFVIPLSQATRLYQLYINYGFEPDQYYSPSRYEYVDPGDAGKRISLQVTSNPDSTLTVAVYLVNNNPSPVSFAAFDVRFRRRDFLDEL